MLKARWVRDERGAELVEFALISIAFFMFVLGTLDFGRMIWDSNVIASAAKEGARWAAVRGATSSSPTDSSGVQTYVQDHVYGLTVTATATWNPTTQAAGSVVTVVVTGSFSPIVGLLPQGTIALTSSAQMITQR